MTVPRGKRQLTIAWLSHQNQDFVWTIGDPTEQPGGQLAIVNFHLHPQFQPLTLKLSLSGVDHTVTCGISRSAVYRRLLLFHWGANSAQYCRSDLNSRLSRRWWCNSDAMDERTIILRIKQQPKLTTGALCCSTSMRDSRSCFTHVSCPPILVQVNANKTACLVVNEPLYGGTAQYPKTCLAPPHSLELRVPPRLHSLCGLLPMPGQVGRKFLQTRKSSKWWRRSCNPCWWYTYCKTTPTVVKTFGAEHRPKGKWASIMYCPFQCMPKWYQFLGWTGTIL